VGEKDDVRAAIADAERTHAAKIDLAGYSFGAWVNAAVAAAKRTAIHSQQRVVLACGGIKETATGGCLQGAFFP